MDKRIEAWRRGFHEHLPPIETRIHEIHRKLSEKGKHYSERLRNSLKHVSPRRTSPTCGFTQRRCSGFTAPKMTSPGSPIKKQSHRKMSSKCLTKHQKFIKKYFKDHKGKHSAKTMMKKANQAWNKNK